MDHAPPAHEPAGRLASMLAADLRANALELPSTPGPRDWLAAVARNVPTVRFAAVLLLRLAQAAGRTWGPAGSLLKQFNHLLTGCDIAYQAQIGPGLILFHPTGVVIGPACRLGARARIMQSSTLGSDEVMIGRDRARSPVLGDDVFIGPGAAIFGDVTLGDRVVVGANSVVTRSFGPDTVVAGAPAVAITPR